MTKAGLADLHFHDLRGSTVTRLAEAGATEPQIAALTGHSMQEVGRMLDRYLSRSADMAKAGMRKLELRTKRRQKM